MSSNHAYFIIVVIWIISAILAHVDLGFGVIIQQQLMVDVKGNVCFAIFEDGYNVKTVQSLFCLVELPVLVFLYVCVFVRISVLLHLTSRVSKRNCAQ